MSSPVCKSLVVPTKGQPLDIKTIVDIVQVGTLCQMSVKVLCFSDKLLTQWQTLLDESSLPSSTVYLDLVDINSITLTEWQSCMCAFAYDITVLSGVCAELQTNHISSTYVVSLIDAVPSGTVVLA